TSMNDVRAAGAARALAAVLQRTRHEAVAKNASIGIRVGFAPSASTLTTYADGDGDGVLAGDIDDGVDRQSGFPFVIEREFPGVGLGALPGLPAIDPSGTPPGNDPVRLGAADMAVFTPVGTATSGTLYLLGRGNMQFAVRIYGETGRTRILRYNAATRQW